MTDDIFKLSPGEADQILGMCFPLFNHTIIVIAQKP